MNDDELMMAGLAPPQKRRGSERERETLKMKEIRALGFRNKRLPLDLSTMKRESLETLATDPPLRASLVDFSKNSSMSSVGMFARQAFFPFRELFAFFPISPPPFSLLL